MQTHLDTWENEKASEGDAPRDGEVVMLWGKCYRIINGKMHPLANEEAA